MPTDSQATINLKPNYLWFLTLCYTMVIVLANWFDPRLVKLFGITTDAGTLIFPATFLLSDLVTEVYGFKHARQAIWCGFLFNLVFILYGQLVIHLPSPDYETNNQMFDTLLALNDRIIMASAISYFLAEPLNSFIMAKSKVKMKGRYLSLRFVMSTVVASAVDSSIFGIIAFYGQMTNMHLLDLILNMWFVKIFIEILGLPISVRLAKNLKMYEKLDVYDEQTDFTLFSLETAYSERDNKFKYRYDK